MSRVLINESAAFACSQWCVYCICSVSLWLNYIVVVCKIEDMMYNVIILFMYIIIVASQLLQMHCGVTICILHKSVVVKQERARAKCGQSGRLHDWWLELYFWGAVRIMRMCYICIYIYISICMYICISMYMYIYIMIALDRNF